MIVFCIILLLTIGVSSCQQVKPVDDEEQQKKVVLCFNNYNPEPYRTPSGSRHIPIPKLLYTDSLGIINEFTPATVGMDTLVLFTKDEFQEFALSYRDFEFIYYPLMASDTILVSMDSLDYPILNSKHHPEYDRIYNINYELRKGNTFQGLEAKTCLGGSWVNIAQNIDLVRKNNWPQIKDYCPLDSLHNMFDNYKQAYRDTMEIFRVEEVIIPTVYDHYQYLLDLKKYESLRFLNEDSTIISKMETHISDKYLKYPSYQEYLSYYIWFVNENIPSIRFEQGGYRDWRITFDEIASSQLPSGSKKMLLNQCLEAIGDGFSAKDLSSYISKYIEITKDSLLPNKLNEQYNLSADANSLLLKDIHGNNTDFDLFLRENRGKIIYVDFWASWCMPCKDEMPHSLKLRKQYADKDVVFVYLAFGDEESKWKEAVKNEGLSDVDNNFFITNSKNSNYLQEIKLRLIPRFIILDKEAKIVALNAPRPSDPEVVNVLNYYLEE